MYTSAEKLIQRSKDGLKVRFVSQNLCYKNILDGSGQSGWRRSIILGGEIVSRQS